MCMNTHKHNGAWSHKHGKIFNYVRNHTSEYKTVKIKDHKIGTAGVERKQIGVTNTIVSKVNC